MNLTMTAFKKILISLFTILVVACAPVSDVDEPVEVVWDKTGEPSDRLIVFIPGLFDTAIKFKKEEFFSIARAAGIKDDLLAAGIHVEHLIQDKLFTRMDNDIFIPAKKAGYKNIWLVGLSLGGLNSLLYFQAHTDEICGVVLLAPFLSETLSTQDIIKASGFKVWQAEQAKFKQPVEQKIQDLWAWMQKENLVSVYLGYGNKDLYLPTHQRLAKLLDKKNITVVDGKHDWRAARAIWQQQMLTREQSGVLKPCK